MDYEKHVNNYNDDLSDIYHVQINLFFKKRKLLRKIINSLPQIADDQFGIFTNSHCTIRPA